MSRWQLHQRLGIRPNTISDTAAELVADGVLVEGEQTTGAMGRPRTPLQIDPLRRHVIGVAFRPGFVEVARLCLRGEPIGSAMIQAVSDGARMIATARQMLRPLLSPETFAIGVSMTGTFDPVKHLSVVSSSWPGLRDVSLEPLYEVAGSLPLLLENDMTALAARWLLRSGFGADGDILMISFGDGVIGGAILVDAGSERGYVAIDNELGHTRLAVDSPPCYCGHRGCLTQLCSTGYLRMLDPASPPLITRVNHYDGTDATLNHLLDVLATGLSNASNVLFSDQLVLVSELASNTAFRDALLERVRTRLAFDRPKLTQIKVWDDPAGRPSQTAGWIALAWMLLGEWSPDRRKVKV